MECFFYVVYVLEVVEDCLFGYVVGFGRNCELGYVKWVFELVVGSCCFFEIFECCWGDLVVGYFVGEVVDEDNGDVEVFFYGVDEVVFVDSCCVFVFYEGYYFEVWVG